MNLWRIHLKAEARKGSDQRQLCIDKGIAGVGWPIDYDTVPVKWDTYYKAAESKYGDRSWRAALNVMKHRMQIDDLIWTRDWQGNYYIGRLLSDWHYDTSIECEDVDTVNVRCCEWHKVGTVQAVPGKIVSSFIASRAVQAVNDHTALYYSQITYNQKSNNSFYKVANQSGTDIFSLLSYDDCEDALAIYLQVDHDYNVIPSSCKNNTAAYEYELKHRQKGSSAVVQVKSGGVSLNIDDYDKLDTTVFLFATNGHYYGTPRPNIQAIDPEIIRNFLYQKTHLLPEKMKTWVELTRNELTPDAV